MLLLYRHREAQRNPQRRVKNMNAFNIYEGAIQNAEQNDLAVDAEYIKDYASGALDVEITTEVAKKIVSCFVAYEAVRGNGNGVDYDYLVKFELQDIEIV